MTDTDRTPSAAARAWLESTNWPEPGLPGDLLTAMDAALADAFCAGAAWQAQQHPLYVRHEDGGIQVFVDGKPHPFKVVDP